MILPGNWIFDFKVDPLNLVSQNHAKNIPVGLSSSKSKFKANRSRGSRLMIGQTNKQTHTHTKNPKQRLQLFIYIDIYQLVKSNLSQGKVLFYKCSKNFLNLYYLFMT